MTNLVAEVRKASSQAYRAYMPGKDTELSEEYLTRKFGRASRKPDPINYEITRDTGLLFQYYRMREDMFIKVWGLKQFCGKKETFDDNSDIMIASIGNHCIGGCRLTFSDNSAGHLPMEKEGFKLSNIVPELIQPGTTYVETSRLAILPDYQNSVVMLELSRQLLKRAAEHKARYAFTLAPLPLARNYRKAASLFGLEWKILSGISIPQREEYEGIKMVLSVLDLAPAYRPKTARTPLFVPEHGLELQGA